MTDATQTAAPVQPAAPAPAPAPAAPVQADLLAAQPTAPAAPAPAPAATPEPPKEPAKDEGKPFTYDATGNTRVDYALGIIGKAGFGAEHPAIVAAAEGDFAMLQHALAAKGLDGSDALVTMLKDEYEADVKAEGARQEQIKSDIVSMAGSEEHWNTVAGFIRENGTEEELGTLRGLLGDSKTHKIAASYMLGIYDKAGGERPARQGVEKEDVVPRGPQAPTPLTRAQFAEEAGKLRRTMGDAYVNSPEYRALYNRVK